MPELEADCGTAAPGNGYDLRQIMIGSEYTLGVVFEAAPSLTGPPPSSQITPLARRL